MRCPFRVKAFDKPDTCDPECAWLMGGYNLSRKCAVAVIAENSAKKDFMHVAINTFEGRTA